MNNKKKEFLKEWKHFLDRINHGGSYHDAQSIRFMNEFSTRLNEVINDENETNN